LEFNYTNQEHNSGTNTIQESNMGAISWSASANKWSYPVRSRVNAGNNNLLLHAGVNFSGIWTLSDTTPCPVANFSSTGSCEKDSVLFIDKSTVAQDTLIRWTWSFGNGNNGSGDSTVGYFSPAGIYNTRLIVTAATGCSDTVFKKINILGAPQANYTVEDTCENTIVKFTSLTSPGSGFIAKEYWWFGDGATYTGKSPQHYYGTSGLPQVKYIVYNSNLCKDTIDRTLYIANKPFVYFAVKPDCEDVNFPFTNASTAGAGSILSYNWDFGNGRRSTLRDENIVYPDSGTFPVRLIVTNTFGCRDTFKQPLRVYPRAIAKFKYSPYDPQMLKPVTFTNLSGIDTKWTWDFGDGYYDITENPIHSYNMYGTYTVTLIADNDYGCADTTSLNLRAKSIPLYWFPNAFTPANTEGLNDQFGLFSPLTVTDYRLMIFNRYGEIIFESTDQTKLWDGRINNELVMGGVYIYDATFKNPENEIQRYSGNVTLVR
ncbi:MAG: PKD domain-containing protein, partial [Bacteroidota bacterium]